MLSRLLRGEGQVCCKSRAAEEAHLKEAPAGFGLPFVGMLPCEFRQSAPNWQRPCWKKRQTGGAFEDMAKRGRVELHRSLGVSARSRKPRVAQGSVPGSLHERWHLLYRVVDDVNLELMKWARRVDNDGGRCSVCGCGRGSPKLACSLSTSFGEMSECCGRGQSREGPPLSSGTPPVLSLLLRMLSNYIDSSRVGSRLAGEK